MAGLGVNLRRVTGAWTPFSVITLEEIMTHMGASEQAYVEFGEVAFWKAGSQRLLLMDVQVNRNRALLELFSLRFVFANPFGLGFRKDAEVMTLAEALVCVGYIGPVNLDALCMQVYDAGAVPYINAGQLVVDGGAFDVRAATLKSLQAGFGVQITPGDSAVTISATGLEGGLVVEPGPPRRFIFDGSLLADNIVTFQRFEIPTGSVVETYIPGCPITVDSRLDAILMEPDRSMYFQLPAAPQPSLIVSPEGIYAPNMYTRDQLDPWLEIITGISRGTDFYFGYAIQATNEVRIAGRQDVSLSAQQALVHFAVDTEAPLVFTTTLGKQHITSLSLLPNGSALFANRSGSRPASRRAP